MLSGKKEQSRPVETRRHQQKQEQKCRMKSNSTQRDGVKSEILAVAERSVILADGNLTRRLIISASGSWSFYVLGKEVMHSTARHVPNDSWSCCNLHTPPDSDYSGAKTRSINLYWQSLNICTGNPEYIDLDMARARGYLHGDPIRHDGCPILLLHLSGAAAKPVANFMIVWGNDDHA